MKTPHAILIGLSLIAAAIYFKDTAIKPANAFGGPDHIACMSGTCLLFEGDTATLFSPIGGGVNHSWSTVNWRTGERIK